MTRKTRDGLIRAVHILGLGIMHCYGDTINGKLSEKSHLISFHLTTRDLHRMDFSVQHLSALAKTFMFCPALGGKIPLKAYIDFCRYIHEIISFASSHPSINAPDKIVVIKASTFTNQFVFTETQAAVEHKLR